jgi:hypothetical protein
MAAPGVPAACTGPGAAGARAQMLIRGAHATSRHDATPALPLCPPAARQRMRARRERLAECDTLLML